MTSSSLSLSVATRATFAAEVLAASHDRLVLVDFWADWCGPCKALAPVLEHVAEQRADRLKVVKVNVDEQPQLSVDHGIRALPTLLLFRDGQVVQQLVGLQSAEAILAVIDHV